jgi:foldase protein PrsA
VALVDGTEVPATKLSELMGQAERNYKNQKLKFPKKGTKEYEQLQAQAVAQLVQVTDLEVGADREDVKIDDEELDKKVEELKKQYFPSKDGKSVDQKKFQDALKQQGITEDQLRDQVAQKLLQEKLYNKVTSKVNVADKDIQSYYDKNKKTVFATPASRPVRHILTKKKAIADDLYRQLISNDDKFPQLAKKFSKDPGSAARGGSLGSITKGQTVPAFDKTAFTIVPGIVSRPVKTQFGWHLIEATGPVKEATTRKLDAALKEQIKQQLSQSKKQDAFLTWFKDLKTDLDKKTTYAKGYEPPPTATTATGTATTSTGG